jgi:hypothetical protein
LVTFEGKEKGFVVAGDSSGEEIRVALEAFDRDVDHEEVVVLRQKCPKRRVERGCGLKVLRQGERGERNRGGRKFGKVR